MADEQTPADELRSVPISWIWVGALVVVALLGYGMTPWETLALLLGDGGVGEESAQLIGFLAGYTLPLTAGAGILAYLGLTARYRGASGPVVLLVAGGVLIGTAMAAGSLGLGQLPAFASGVPTPQSGPWYAWPLAWALNAYVNSYGWALVISSTAVGLAAAIHLERWFRNDQAPAGGT